MLLKEFPNASESNGLPMDEGDLIHCELEALIKGYGLIRVDWF